MSCDGHPLRQATSWDSNPCVIPLLSLFKSLLNFFFFYNIASVLYFVFFWPRGMWDLSSNQGLNTYLLHWKVKS